jgi:hypothetical protein
MHHTHHGGSGRKRINYVGDMAFIPEAIKEPLSSKVFHFALLSCLWSYFLVPYFPTYSPIIFGKSFFATQILMLLATGALFWNIFDTRNEPRVGMRMLRGLVGCLTAFLGLLIISTFVSHGWSQDFFSRMLSVMSIGIITLLCSHMKRRWLGILFVSVAIFNCLASVLGMLQFYFFGDAASPAAFLGNPYSVFYATGFANYPSLFAVSLAFFLPLALWFYATDYLRLKWLWAVSFTLSGVGILLSLARSAMLAALFGLIVMFIVLWRELRYRKETAMLLMVTGLIVLAAFFYQPAPSIASPLMYYQISAAHLIAQRFAPLARFLTHFASPASRGSGRAGSMVGIPPAERLEITDRSTYSRYIFHATGMRMLRATIRGLLFGYGVRGFTDQWEAFRGSFPAQNDIDPHSTFLEIVTAAGITGLLLFLLFLWYLCRTLWRYRTEEPLVVPLLVSLLIFMIDGLFHTHVYTKYFWMLIGIAIAVMSTLPSSDRVFHVQKTSR